MSKRGCTLGCLFWSLPLALLTIWSLYWSWCWGWWGQNRYLRYFLQCNCPAASEEARYPADVDVLIPACRDPAYVGAIGYDVSPSGRYALFVPSRSASQIYLYDRLTDTIRPFSDNYRFLTDDLGFLFESGSFYLSTIDGARLGLLRQIDIPGQYLLEPSTLNILRQSEKVYRTVITIVALAPGFDHLSEPGYLIRWSGRDTVYPAFQGSTVTQALEGNGITYETVMLGDSPLIVIEDKYLLGGEGISPGVVRVPQPLLRKRFPLESYAPEARPRIEARWAQEQEAKVQAAAIFWSVIGGALAIGLWVFWRRRRLA